MELPSVENPIGNNFCRRLIYCLGKNDRVAFLTKIEANNQDEKLYPILKEVKEYLADD